MRDSKAVKLVRKLSRRWASEHKKCSGKLVYQYHALSLEKLEHCKATHAQKISFRLAHFISYDRFTLQLLRTAGPHTFLPSLYENHHRKLTMDESLMKVTAS